MRLYSHAHCTMCTEKKERLSTLQERGAKALFKRFGSKPNSGAMKAGVGWSAAANYTSLLLSVSGKTKRGLKLFASSKSMEA